MNRFALTNSPFWRANFACDANARHCSLGFGAVLAGGTACTVFPAAGGTPNAGSVLGGSVLGGNGGKSPCCALTRSDVVEIATVAATLGQVAAQATVKSRNVLRGFRDFNATLLIAQREAQHFAGNTILDSESSSSLFSQNEKLLEMVK